MGPLASLVVEQQARAEVEANEVDDINKFYTTHSTTSDKRTLNDWLMKYLAVLEGSGCEATSYENRIKIRIEM